MSTGPEPFGKRLQGARLSFGLSQEDLATKAGLHRTAVGLIESGEREPLLSTAVALSSALGVPLADLVYGRDHRSASGSAAKSPNPELDDITPQDIVRAIESTYQVLDLIDGESAARGGDRLAKMVELANLSAIVGNVFAAALASGSQGRWIRNGPHKYPDLIRPASLPPGGTEIKVALEDNSPKGHLPKPGPHIFLRYVLAHASPERRWKPVERGDTVAVWEVRAGKLGTGDFNLSNTPGDSGKSAVVKSAVLKRLRLEYFDPKYFPGRDPARYQLKFAPEEGAPAR
jgi:transcriptional regulator with XRE-family HTH domain